jgi:uncharacterized protein YbaA (DUF1428 family)
MWMKLGALEYYECRGNDLVPQDMGGMKARAFPEMAGAASGETVWFSFIVFKSKKHRDQVNAKVMKDPLMQDPSFNATGMPVDMKRFTYGGFKVEVGV